MKTALHLLIIVFGFSIGLNAQVEIRYNGVAAPDTKTINNPDVSSLGYNDPLKLEFYVVNIGNQDYTLNYKRIRRYHKYGWDDQVCDVICYNIPDEDVWIRPNDDGSAPILSPGESSIYTVYAYPREIAGCSIYSYIITNAFGVAIDSVQVTFSLGNLNCFLGTEDEEVSINYSVYPNPAIDILTVEAEISSELTSINLYNILGKQILNQPLNNGINTIDVSSLSSGVYFYSINVNNKAVETKKLIIR